MAHYLSMQVCKFCVCDATFFMKYWNLNVGVLRKQNQVLCVLAHCRLLLGVCKLGYMRKRRVSLYNRLLDTFPQLFCYVLFTVCFAVYYSQSVLLCTIHSLLKKHTKYVNINL